MLVSKFTIAQRLFLWAFAVSLAAIITVSLFYDREAESAIAQRSFDQLVSVRTLKKSKVEDYFESLRSMLFVLASHPATVLTSAREMRSLYGVQDIVICSDKGQILYDFSRKERIGAAFDSLAFSAIKQEIDQSQMTDSGINVHFTDMLRIGDSLAAFGIVRIDSLSAATVKRETSVQNSLTARDILPLQVGNMIVVQIPIAALNAIMLEREGLGMTGESYIVGNDGRMRTDSRFLHPHLPLQTRVNTLPVKAALQGQSGCLEALDYRSVKVLSAFAPLQIDHVSWAIIVELDVEEITTPISAARTRIVLIGLALTLLMALISWFGARRFAKPIVALQERLTALSRGSLPAEPLVIKRSDEIGEMTRELNTMTDSFREATLFARDIGAGRFDTEYKPRSEGDILVISLNEMKRELQELLQEQQEESLNRTRAFLEGEERERARLSREIHDGVGQTLTALKFNLNRVADAEMRSELLDLADDAIAEVRAVSHNLMPRVLVDFGLEAALELLCQKLGEKISNDTISETSDLSVVCRIQPIGVRLDSAREIAMYRIAQEALTNAIRYAKAREIRLDFCLNSAQTLALMTIQDDGQGFDTSSNAHGNGLGNMRERAVILGGKVEIESEIGLGTRVFVEIPVST